MTTIPTTTRRALLATAAAAPLLPIAAGAAVSPDDGPSAAMLALLGDWHRARDWADDRGDPHLSDAEIEQRMIPVEAAEDAILSRPPESLIDLAVKIQIVAATGWGLEHGLDALADDARQVLMGAGQRWLEA